MNGDEKKKRVVPVSFLLLRYSPRLARSQSESDNNRLEEGKKFGCRPFDALRMFVFHGDDSVAVDLSLSNK
jgi:hypothetical protein